MTRCLAAAAMAVTAAIAPRTSEAQVGEPGPHLPAWMYPAASMLVPGSGQLLAGRDRGLVYVAVEAGVLTRFFTLWNEGRRERTRFRDLAYNVARGPFDPGIRDTVWSYFEKLETYVESGPFDTDPGPALAPPTDERTYNGSLWALARRTFFANPDSTPDPESEEYQRALEFYRTRAVGPDFQWSWRNAGLEQDLYRQAIGSSDDAFRSATQHLGLLLANHLLSAIDALVSGKLSRAGTDLSVRSAVWAAHRSGWQAVVSVSVALRSRQRSFDSTVEGP